MVLVNKLLKTILTTKRYHNNVIARYKHPFKPYLLITKKGVVDSIFHYLIPISLKKLSFYEMTESLHRAFIATLALLQRQYSERDITNPAEQWFSNIAVSTEVMFKKLQFT